MPIGGCRPGLDFSSSAQTRFRGFQTVQVRHSGVVRKFPPFRLLSTQRAGCAPRRTAVHSRLFAYHGTGGSGIMEEMNLWEEVCR